MGIRLSIDITIGFTGIYKNWIKAIILNPMGYIQPIEITY